MLKFLRGPILGIIAIILWFANIGFWMVFFTVIALLKLLLPIPYLRRGCSGLLDDIASSWMWVNNAMITHFIGIKWEVVGDLNMKMNDWYLVMANHQSWSDIVVLTQVLNKKIPFLKFFLKAQLRYVPVLGFAWWALDYPFMKRFSKKMLQKKPHLKGKDLEITRKACEKFKQLPISVMNFVEGTRLTVEKQMKQKAPFKHLLLPKAGGVAHAMQILGKQFNQIIDVTIVYPKGIKSLWSLLCGKIDHVKIYLRSIPINAKLIGDYQNDPEFRKFFQQWLNQLWQEKDQLLIAEQHG